MSEEPRRERGDGRLFQRGRVWWIQFNFRGKQYRKSAETDDKAKAAKKLRKKLAEIEGGRLISPQAERLVFEDMAKMKTANYVERGLRSTERLESALKHLREAFGLSRAVDIDEMRLDKYRAARLSEIDPKTKKPASRATVNYEMAILRSMFNMARKRKMLRDCPSFPMFSAAELDNVREGFTDYAGIKKIVAGLPEHQDDAALFAYTIGWRLRMVVSERGLRWDQVDLDAGTIRLDPKQTKNKKAIALNIAEFPDIKDILARRWERTQAMQRTAEKIIPWVFWHRDGQPLRDFRRSWEKACAAAGMPGLLFHDLRRSCARNLVRAGVPEQVAMQVTGHRTRSVFERYNITTEDDIKEAGRRLASYAVRAAAEAESKGKGTFRGQFGTSGDSGSPKDHQRDTA
jgi:integrase